MNISFLKSLLKTGLKTKPEKKVRFGLSKNTIHDIPARDSFVPLSLTRKNALIPSHNIPARDSFVPLSLTRKNALIPSHNIPARDSFVPLSLTRKEALIPSQYSIDVPRPPSAN
jgi:hypothetical protein